MSQEPRTTQATAPTSARHKLLLFGAVVLLIPWLFLLHHLETLRTAEEEALNTGYRLLMVAELEDTYRDLQPKEYIRQVFEEIDRSEGLLSPKENNIRHPPPGQDPGFFPSSFIHRRLKTLARLGLKPFFISSGDCDLRRFRWWASSDILTSVAPLYLAELAGVTLIETAQARELWLPSSRKISWLQLPSVSRKTFPRFLQAGPVKWVVPQLSSHGLASPAMAANASSPVASGKPEISKETEPQQQTRTQRSRDLRKDLSRILFGYYWNFNNFVEGAVQESFSDNLGRQSILTYLRFLYSNSGPRRATFGGYTAFFRENDLPYARILEKALAKAHQHPLLSRTLITVKKVEHLASTTTDPNRLTGPLPLAFSRLFPNQSGETRELAIHLHRLPDDNPFHTARSIVFLSGIVFFAVALTIRLLAGFDLLPLLGLRWKLVAIISLTVLLPFAGLGLLSLQWLNGHGDELPGRVATRMETRAVFLEERIREWAKHRQVFNAHVRTELPRLLSLRKGSLEAATQRLLDRFAFGDYLVILNRDGTHAMIGGGKNLQQTSFHVALGNRLLQSLYAAKTRQSAKELIVNDFMDFFWKLNRASGEIVREGMEARYIFGLQENQHLEIFLIPAASAPLEIGGIAFLRMQYSEGFQKRLDGFLQQRFPLFWDTSPYSTSRFAIFQTETVTTSGKSWPPDAIYDRRLRELAEPDASLRSSFLVQRNLPNERTLQTLAKADPYGFSVSALSRLPTKDSFQWFGRWILGALLVYATFLAFLTADLLSVLFLEPIRILVGAARAVGNGLYETRVPQDSGDEFGDMGKAFNRMSVALQQREALRAFLPERLVRQITSNSQEAERKGEHVEVIILASDIRGFTSLTEHTPPDLLVETLNDYFTHMQDAITAEGGMILKLVGDAILAAFYPDREGRLPIEKAVRAARKMRRSLEEWNATRRTAGLFPLENGIGLAIGPVLSGELGGRHGRRDFTVVGQVLAEATSLEALSARASSSRIIVDEMIRASLPVDQVIGPVLEAGDGGRTGWEITS